MIKTSFLFIASVLAAGTLLGGTASPALAAAPEAPVRAVGYADLDLTGAAGRARLEQRIDTAVRAVCGRAAPTDLNGRNQVELCRADALADAAVQQRSGQVFVAEAGPGAIVFDPR